MGEYLTMNDIAQLLINSSGAALVAGMFLWYLSKRDKVIERHLEDGNSSSRELAKQIQHFSDVIAQQKEVLGDQSEMLRQLYEENYKKLKRIRSLESKN